MDPAEVWWMVEALRPPKMYGSLPESEIAELWEEAKAEGIL